jgi:hypothetical protein
MNGLSRMPKGAGNGRPMHVVQPGMPVVRGTPDSTPGHAAAPARRDHGQASKGVGRLGGLWARRFVAAQPRQTAGLLRTGWPGIGYGVRAPEIGETPLSHSEWPYLFRGDLS